jgi:Tfp pilus assembly protein PilO
MKALAKIRKLKSLDRFSLYRAEEEFKQTYMCDWAYAAQLENKREVQKAMDREHRRMQREISVGIGIPSRFMLSNPIGMDAINEACKEENRKIFEAIALAIGK